MKLGQLWQRFGGDAGTAIPQEAEELFIFGVADDSRDVRFGYLFCAIEGRSQDGLKFCAQAASKGAQAIAVSSLVADSDIGLSDYEREKVVILRVSDVRSFYPRLCGHFYSGGPEVLVGVTGTNGKTSTVSFVRDIWDASGRSALSLGTLGIRSRRRAHTNLEAGLTTFDAKTLHIMLGELRRAHGITHVAMEASSHALHQGRLAGLHFDAAVFTNLTLDHLDYHETMENYFAAKALLFRERLKRGGVAIINIDDPKGRDLAKELKSNGIETITYCSRADTGDLRLLRREPRAVGQQLLISIWDQEFSFELPLAGAFQGDNILAAIGAAIATGLSAEEAVGAAGSVAPVPGRLELVSLSPTGASVYVDYAHTPDALDNVLRSLRPHVRPGSRLHVVFGCGGDRDPTKRPVMGKIASNLADRAWVTDDNPRSEDPNIIRKQIVDSDVRCIDAGDRRTAIARAIASAENGDVVIVAGKGHEDYQILPKLDNSDRQLNDETGRTLLHKVRFSDQELILELCN